MPEINNVAVNWNPMSEELKIVQDVERETVEIEGLKYSFELFRGLGFGRSSLSLNEPFAVVKREDGVITIQKIKDIEPWKMAMALLRRWLINRWHCVKKNAVR